MHSDERAALIAALEEAGATYKVLHGNKTPESTALYQVIHEWKNGGRVTARAAKRVFDHLQAIGKLKDAQRATLERLASSIENRRNDLPRAALSPNRFHQRLESYSVERQDLKDPTGFLDALDKMTSQDRASRNLKTAMNTAWHFVNILSLKQDHLSLGDDYRKEAAAYSAWFLAWMALQIESRQGVTFALASLERLSDGSVPSIETAKHTVRSYFERITHVSDEYPDVDHARRAYASSKQRGGVFSADLNDPLIQYNAANELRLLKAPLNRREDLFGGITLLEQLKINAEMAVEMNRPQEAARILGSLARGLVNDGRLDDAEIVSQKLLTDSADQSGWMLSSKANALHASGLIDVARGKQPEKLREANRIYMELKAFKRAEDVLMDWQKMKGRFK